MDVIEEITRAWSSCGRPYKMKAAKLRLAMAAMDMPETKIGELGGAIRMDGRKLFEVKGIGGK